jgi:hypothetical protein
MRAFAGMTPVGVVSQTSPAASRTDLARNFPAGLKYLDYYYIRKLVCKEQPDG